MSKKTSQAVRIEVVFKPDLDDTRGRRIRDRIARDLGIRLKAIRVADVYTLDLDLSEMEINRVRAELFTDPLTQDSSKGAANKLPFDWAIEVGYLPGVTDNPGRTSREAIEDMLRRKFPESEAVYTSRLYLIEGDIEQGKVDLIAGLLYNPLIEHSHIKSRDRFLADGGMGVIVPRVTLPPSTPPSLVNLDVSDQELAKIGKHGIFDHVAGDGTEIRRGPLALDLPSLYAIRDYFQEENRQPTDVELESLAQTWSEHCKHTIFASRLDDIENGLYKTFIQAATKKVRAGRGSEDWCVSVFTDNSGVIKFTDDYNVCYKVETHNSPSALDPYGGAITGIVGVNRDPLGTGKGAKLSVNVYGFCFGDPYFDKELPYRKPGKREPILHPRVIFEGVRRGVEDGGNKSGIPTAWGFVRFDPRYMGKPLVFVGTIGVMPAIVNREPSHLKRARPGDLIVMAGGRVGKDGIHGATFSSEGLHAGSPAGAVQIGDPITQKKLGDAQQEARDLDLYTSVTDNGAGGLSCSVGEMARECGGCYVELDKVPLKYPGLAPYEIWISESQERMTYAVMPEKIDTFLDLMRRRGVEATVIGQYTDTGRCVVDYHGKRVMDVDLTFLHDGAPRKELKSSWVPPKHPEPRLKKPDLTDALEGMMSRLNVCSKEYVVRQFDHEVQGGAIVKPLVGARQDVHQDAVVYKPILDVPKAVAITSTLFPSYGDIDPYWMAACAIDAAFRNVVCVGADPGKIALLDNFCWCSSDRPEMLGKLKLAARACYDMALAYRAPFISGKDSMFNDFHGYDAGGKPVTISIPPTLLISAIGVVHDAARCVTCDLKRVGDRIYILGVTKNELGGSEYFAMRGDRGRNEPYIGNTVPTVDPDTSLSIYIALSRAITAGMVSATASVTVGGIGTSLGRMTMAGELGADIDLKAVPHDKVKRDDYLLFSETAGRVIVSVPEEKAAGFEALFKGLPAAMIGRVVSDRRIKFVGLNGKTVSADIEKLRTSYKKPLEW